MVVARQRPVKDPAARRRSHDLPTRAAALRRIAAEVSGRQDLDGLFQRRHRRGLHAVRRRPGRPVDLRRLARRRSRLVAQRGLSREILEIVATLAARRPDGRDGPRSASARSASSTASSRRPCPTVRAHLPRAPGIRTICFVPIVFRDVAARPARPLPPRPTTPGRPTRPSSPAPSPTTWRPPSATPGWPIRPGRWPAGCARSPSSPAGSTASRTSTGSPRPSWPRRATLIDHDTIRVYRVDHDDRDVRADRLPGHVHGRRATRTRTLLRVAIGEGLTGWVAAHGETVRLGDAAADPRGRSIVRSTDGPESMLLVPMTFDGTRPRRHRRVEGRARPVRRRRRDDPGDLRRLRGPGPRQRARTWSGCSASRRELEHQLDGQRRLLEVNERLLSTLEPAGVLDLIADSLKAIVPVRLADHLPGRPGRRRPPRGHRPRPVRRPDPRPREPARGRASPAGSSTTARPSWPTRPTSIRARSRCPAPRSSPSR